LAYDQCEEKIQNAKAEHNPAPAILPQEKTDAINVKKDNIP